MAFRQTISVLSEKSKSKSASWASRQFRDPYVKKRLSDPAAYRARSAFKLLEVDETWTFLDHPDVNAVVDLGAAPGGWSQVVASKLGWTPSPSTTSEPVRARPKPERLAHFDPLNIDDVGGHATEVKGRGKIISVDLLDIAPIPGVHTIKADFMDGATTRQIKQLLIGPGNPFGKADVILSDMAANITGHEYVDIQSSCDICEAVFEFTRNNLRTADSIGRKQGGVLLIKYFDHPLLQGFLDQYLKPNFQYTHRIKPKSSRATSRENYFLCRGWNP
ncbi:23S ribosomal RNA methyltransferase [Pholiota conissans]|uniref:rRNA methyltransferase 2, mitochondrial n=1 Tax=Pholiota conissans TaxID=109636 RepID=A0A9P6CQV4_9AGAR|nr:23S ribosomal RNA methyltransferase [Pholiota conissans]